MWSDNCTFQTQGRGWTSSGCSLMTALKTSYTVTDITVQPPACPSALLPQRILQTWSARDVACRVRSSRLAISFHICSQPDCRSLSSCSRITPANQERGCHAHQGHSDPKAFEIFVLQYSRGAHTLIHPRQSSIRPFLNFISRDWRDGSMFKKRAIFERTLIQLPEPTR